MARPLFAVLPSLFLLANLLQARDRTPQYAQPRLLSTSETNAFLSLIQQSHDLDQLLTLATRVEMLARQAEIVSQVSPALGRDWANELFTLSLQVEADRRSKVQSRALRLLIRLDPEQALELLHQVGNDEPEGKPGTLPAVTELAQQVFAILVTRDGEAALPVLEQEAERLGLQGHYPYAALGYAAMDASNKYWGNDNPRAVRILQSIFQPAFARYNQAPRNYFDDCEFGRMLQVLAGGLPFDSLQPALHMLVKNLLAIDTNKYHFRAELYGARGEKLAAVHNAIDAAILQLGSLIDRDSELTQELESSRPQLLNGLELIKSGEQRSASFGPELPPQNASTPKYQEVYMDAVSLSHINANEAIAKAEQLPDDKRTRALLQVARGVARYDPERAAAVIAEVQQGNERVGEETFLDIISTQAFVAAGQNDQTSVHNILQQGFESANHIIAEQEKSPGIRSSLIAVLPPLIHIGMENEPDFTIPFLEGLPPSRLKIELLLVAAEAVAYGRQPTLAHAQQTAEKPKL